MTLYYRRTTITYWMCASCERIVTREAAFVVADYLNGYRCICLLCLPQLPHHAKERGWGSLEFGPKIDNALMQRLVRFYQACIPNGIVAY